MNENLKTLVYVGLAVLVGAGAWAATRITAPHVAGVVDETGQPFFPEFKDPLTVARFRVVDFDESTGELRDFEVLNGPKGWTIPSHDSYPADAQRQVEEAAASVIDLKKLGHVSDLPGDQELYGVIDPSTQLERGATGVGKRVSMEDSGGNRLAEFIIGKTDPEQPTLRFVRVPNQDRIYRVAVDTSRLSTRFQDWIEKDLLKLNNWDVRQVMIDGYSIDELNGVKVPGDRLELTYNDRDAKWTMADLPEGEALDDTKLNDMKSSLDNLQIVDVRRKPAGLSRELKAEDVSNQERREGMISLHDKGYYISTDGQLLSNEGEVLVGTAEGVEYVLRFGNVAPSVEGDDGAAEPAAEDAPAEGQADPAKKAAEGENRYLFVMAQPNLDLIPKPEGVDVSDILAGARIPDEEAPKDEAAGAVDDQPAEDEAPSTDETDADGPAGEEPSTEEPAGDEPAGSEGGGDGALAQAAPAGNADEEEAAKENTDDEAAEPAATADDEAPADETPADEAHSDDGAKDADAAAGEDAPQTDADDKAAPAAGEAPRGTKAIDEAAAALKAKKETERQRDEFEEKVKKAHDRVKELNDRFADWYYVISDSMFKKIHLTRAEVLKKAGSATEDPTGDAAHGHVFPPANAGNKDLLDLEDPRDLGPPLSESH